ncbi:MAG: DNA primase [Euryarchaeota archaeon]|nr:DNA primase [Euryarchaeota archaeon]
MNIDPTAMKYVIHARLQTDGIVEKPDIVGAIFGQTEGLLGDELDLRDLQKSGRMGRIEVEVEAQRGKSIGKVTMPSSLDQVETAILAAALETIDRVGPCKARIDVDDIEDVRVQKKNKIVERARVLLQQLMEKSKVGGADLTMSVRQSLQAEEVVAYGKDRCDAGPNVQDSDAIVVVEGRSDVLNLLRHGIKNAIAVGGTNIPRTIQDLSKERIVTAFVDGDRGGELILRELLQVAEVDFIARAPRGREVEELTQKQIMKALRNKMSMEQFLESVGGPQALHGNARVSLPPPPEDDGDDDEPPARRQPAPEPARPVQGPPGADHAGAQPAPFQQPQPGVPVAAPPPDETALAGAGGEERRSGWLSSIMGRRPDQAQPGRPGAPAGKRLSAEQGRLKQILDKLGGTAKANLVNVKGNVVSEIPVRDLAESLKSLPPETNAVVFDGIITQRLLDAAAECGLRYVVGMKTATIAKLPANVEVWTKPDLE